MNHHRIFQLANKSKVAVLARCIMLHLNKEYYRLVISQAQ